jgi:hypothetical protein
MLSRGRAPIRHTLANHSAVMRRRGGASTKGFAHGTETA